MFISNRVTMVGDWPTIWRLSSQIENWPTILPHYRKVKMLDTDSAKGHFAAYMSAWRNILPVSWWTNQTRVYNDDPAKARVDYKHVGGVTRGMDVSWTFKPTGQPNELLVEITHAWTPNWPLVGNLASRLICQLIVHNIADKTLATIRRLALAGNQAEVKNPKSLTFGVKEY